MTMTKPPEAKTQDKYSAEANNQIPEVKPDIKQEGGRVRVGSIVKELLKPKRKRNIGITISIRINETSVWTNGMWTISLPC